MKRKDTELAGLRAQVESFQRQGSDHQQHIAVLREQISAKDQQIAMLQADVSTQLPPPTVPNQPPWELGIIPPCSRFVSFTLLSATKIHSLLRECPRALPAAVAESVERMLSVRKVASVESQLTRTRELLN